MTAVILVQIAIVALFWVISAPLRHRTFFRYGAISMAAVGVIGVILNRSGFVQPTAFFGFLLLIGGLFIEETLRLIGLFLAARIAQGFSDSSRSSSGGLSFGLGFGLVELIPKLWALKDGPDAASLDAPQAYMQYLIGSFAAVGLHIIISVVCIDMCRRRKFGAALLAGVVIHGFYNFSAIITFHSSASGALVWTAARFACVTLAVWLLLAMANRERGAQGGGGASKRSKPG